jgi:dienelactone hydrolase
MVTEFHNFSLGTTMYRKTVCFVLLATASAGVLAAASEDALAAARLATKPSSATTTYLGYNPSTGTNNKTYHILYQLPNANQFGPGPYPVFLWAPGTYEYYSDPQSLIIVQSMAAQGFLAASVQYDSSEPIQDCTAYTERAQSVFNATVSTSAVSVLCLVKGAACSKGIVTGGISQGGMLAVLSKNYAPQVAATFAMSVSDYNMQGIGVDLSACMDKQHTAIPADRLTIVNGVADQYFGGQQPLENVSGYTCPTGTQQCWSPTGSGAGWYIVQNSQVTDGSADHCYQLVGGCAGRSFDPNWYLPSTYNWSLLPNIDWLATFGTKRVFSSTGY